VGIHTNDLLDCAAGVVEFSAAVKIWKSLVIGIGVGLAGCQSEVAESTVEQHALNTTSHDFGTVQVGATSGTFTFVENPPALHQAGFLVTALSASCSDFGIGATDMIPFNVLTECDDPCDPVHDSECPSTGCNHTVAHSFSFQTFFQPAVASPSSCAMHLQINSSSDVTVTVTGTGMLPPRIVGVQPSSVPFGDVRRNGTTSSPSVINVRSAGSSTLTVSSVTVSAGFAITSGPSSVSLPTGAQQGYNVVCNSVTVGMVTGNFTVVSDDPATGTLNVPLSCNVIDSNLDVTPSPAAIATTRVGEPRTLAVILKNSGAAVMTIESVTATGTGVTLMAGPPAGTTLAAGGGTATATVKFDAVAKGNATGSLVVKFDGQTRTTPISARALATSMSVTPDGDLDFGPVCVGQSKHQLFTVIANQEGSFQLKKLSGDLGTVFKATATLPANVMGSAANQVNIDIEAKPAAATVTAATASLETDIPGATPRDLHLTVQGLPAGVTATPDSADLGITPINTATIGRQLHLSNCGAGPLAFSNARIEGPDAGEFAIVDQPTAATIALGGNVTWLVVLQAHSAGPKQATFAVDYDGGSTMIPLAGEGTDSATGGGSGEGGGPGSGSEGETPAGRASYYACSTGRPSMLWPLALVVVALQLRRRRQR
jgi:MYXO-CTERM domain-containing protein